MTNPLANQSFIKRIVILLIVVVVGYGVYQYFYSTDVPLTRAPYLKTQVEPVPSQFAHFTEKDWQTLWNTEISKPSNPQRNALLDYIGDSAHYEWGKKYIDRGKRLLEKNELIFLRFPAYPLTLDWHADPFHSRSWLMRYHGLEFVGWLTFNYNHTHDKRYLEKAKSVTLSWIRACRRGEPNTPEMAWHDHSTAIRLLVLGYLWETLRQTQYPLAPDEVKDLALSIHDHMDVMHQPTFYNKGHNHGFFQSRSVFVISHFADFSRRTLEWRKKGLSGMIEYLENSVTEEGVLKEHSATYHIILMKLFKQNMALLKMLQVEPELQQKMERRIAAMELFGKHMQDAAQLLVPVGDSSWSKPHMIARPYPEETIKVFPKSGFASFRNKWQPPEQVVHLFFTNSYFGRVHKQGDNLGFHLSAFGKRWLVDAGNIGYNRNVYRDHAMSSLAHNTVVVDESTMEIKNKVKPYKSGTNTIQGLGWIGVRGYHRMSRGMLHIRSIRYNRDKAFEIADTLEPDTMYRPKKSKPLRSEHTFDLLFHFPPEVKLARHPWGVVATQPGVDWELVVKPQSEQPFETLEIISGQTKPYLLGWYYPVYGKATPLNTLRFRYTGKALPLVTTSMYFRKRGSADENHLLTVKP